MTGQLRERPVLENAEKKPVPGVKANKWLFGLALFILLGAALQKVFSLSLGHLSDGRPFQVERSLLLSDSAGILSESQSRKVLRNLQEPLVKPYSVQSNEWMEKIAKDLGIPAIAIRSTNNLEDPALHPHQLILVQNKSGMMHVAKEGESLDSVVKTYEKLGAKREKILAANNLDEISYFKDGELCLIEGSTLWIPDARRSYPFLSKPVNWLRISSRFGLRRHPLLHTTRRHDGYDLVAPYGSPVFAGQDGVVTFAGWEGGYGNMIQIRHANITTRYGHLSKINVEVGQRVKRRQMIGRVGSTGLSTGPHLHFEVRRNSDGKAVRPGKYLY